MRSRDIAAWAAAVALGCLGAAGCSRVSQAEAPPGTGARLLATAGFGARPLLDRRVQVGGSVMRATRGATPVETAYGGDFVSTMLGLKSDLGAKRDWFYYVNGIEGEVGARQRTLHRGETVWWDYRGWGGLMDVPAVVGSWPEPFLHGAGGDAPTVAADPPLAGALRDAGARIGGGQRPWRVRVGSDAALRRRDPAWRRAAGAPVAAGLTVRIAGHGIEALRTGGRGWAPVPTARALAAMVPTGSAPHDGALLAVVGLDAAAARAAARRIATDPSVLRLRYAVAFDAAGEPVAAGGRAAA
ncbi:MAG TPA: DUF4430 domain-containing protein [Miltoncostaeaceae bacterium]|nr:DUF4430 domain-containing protein [Miltoncostaeaceae bacterium]